MLGLAGAMASQAEVWVPSDPGAAKVAVSGSAFQLKNAAITFRWDLSGQGALDIYSAWDGQHWKAGAQPFMLNKRKAGVLQVSGLKSSEAIHGFDVAASGRLPAGKGVAGTWVDSVSGLKVHFSAVLRNGSHYVQTHVDLTPTKGDVDLSDVTLVDLYAHGYVNGTVPGSPITSGNRFFGLEHPMADSVAGGDKILSGIQRQLPMKNGQTTSYSAVFGVSAPGQMRRSVLRYVERERARAYSPFLHYNSWYDLGYFTKYTADQCVERINTFGEELVKKRGVKLSSFLFDDGWDDTSTVWQFHSGFPDGFTPLKEAAAKYGAAPGIWLSPWGGYGDPRKQRLETGKAQGYEIDEQGYALSGPKYYDRFHQVCLDLVGKYGINQFKLDGTGSPDKQYPGSKFGSDFEAAIQLIEDLRAAKPGLFINLTTGTWPSPFWTQYADSIWRGGWDHEFTGVGTWRQKWITYRDGDVFEGIVTKGPYYPLNSLMLHGMIYAQHARNLMDDPSGDFHDEVRDYFGTGTQLQEMYITPSLLSKQNWDDIAESAKWSRANAGTLVDTHWVGGDPRKLEVYGYASWSSKKGILMLRNPNDKVQTFEIDPAQVFELPSSVKGAFMAKSPFASDPGPGVLTLVPGKATKVTLKPFEVLTLEATPVK